MSFSIGYNININKINLKLKEMSKQTAVEWLINQHFGSIENCTPDFRMKIQKAKKMEKQQIIDFAKKCLQENDCFFDIEQYYDETFKK